MSDSLALLETRTIARGIEAADAMVKEAPVTLALTRIVEPGRYLVLVTGSVDDVRQSLRRGRAVAGDDVHDELHLPGPHRALLQLLGIAPAPAAPSFRRPVAVEALGLIECASVAATLLAADAAAKVAAVELRAVRFGPDMHGKGLVAVRGEVADVDSAVTRGAHLAEERGMLVRTAVIPRAAGGVADGAGAGGP